MAVVNGTGQGGKTLNDRELAARVRTLTLKECEKALKKKKGKFYEAILLKLAGSVLPRINEVSGPEGGNIPVAIYGGESIKTLPRYDGPEKGFSNESAYQGGNGRNVGQ